MILIIGLIVAAFMVWPCGEIGKLLAWSYCLVAISFTIVLGSKKRE
jgi:hypothetical protein